MLSTVHRQSVCIGGASCLCYLSCVLQSGATACVQVRAYLKLVLGPSTGLKAHVKCATIVIGKLDMRGQEHSLPRHYFRCRYSGARAALVKLEEALTRLSRPVELTQSDFLIVKNQKTCALQGVRVARASRRHFP